MANFLTYSEVDTDIQSRMQGSAPDQTKRLNAINLAAQNLGAKYDIDSTKREKIVYIVPNGDPINLSTEIPDYKNIKDLRYLNKSNGEFRRIEDDIFDIHSKNGALIDEYTTTFNNGKEYLRVSMADGYSSTDLHACNSLTENGTWAVVAASDAVNLSLNTVNSVNSGGALQFDIDVSNSVNNYAVVENSTITSLDLTSYLGLGRARFWVYLPSVTEFTSVELRWGSSSSDYYSAVATTNIDGSPLVSGLNHIEIDWADATSTGSPDVSAVDYLAIKLNYTASFTDQTAVRVEGIKMFLPMPVRIVYYSSYVSQTTSGTFQPDLTATSSDEILLPRRFKNLLVLESLKILWPMSMGQDSTPYLNQVYADYSKEEKSLDATIGNRPNVNRRRVKIHNPLD